MRVLSNRALNVYLLLVFLLIGLTSCVFVDEEPVPQDESVEIHNYDRLDEVRKACSSIISSAPELKLNDDEISRIKKELSFLNGDWEQQGTTAPLIPFDDRSPKWHGGRNHFYNMSHPKSPYKLVSFRLNDFSTAHQSKRTVGVSGVLLLVITSDIPLATLFDRPAGRPDFSMWEGHSQLFIKFQGIYAESKKNGGERLLCLLGNTMLPAREPEATDPWESVKASISGSSPPPLLQDDQILLVLHYPKTVSLKRRAIQGEMRSLNSNSNEKYFDKVQMTSQVQVEAHDYEFSPDEVISKACDPYPVRDDLVSSTSEIYKGLDFCKTLRGITTDAAFVVSPHWQCNGTDEFCRKFGPFGSNKEINATDGSFKDVRIIMQNILCVPTKTRDNGMTARVSAVFRAFDSPDSQFVEFQRNGLGNMTLVAEGMWKSSSGQLCMIGCVGTADIEGKGCDSRICLYIPLLFSITQRSVLVGSISSIQHDNPPYFPLSLEIVYQYLEYIYDCYVYAHPYYRYSKIDAAGVVLEKNEPFSFRTVVKKSLLTFPRIQDSEDYSISLGLLAEDLSLHVSAVVEPSLSSQSSITDIDMEVLALGSMFGRGWFSNNSMANKETPYHTNATYTEKQLLLNVSTQLKLRKGPYSNFLMLFLEGLYDQHVGKMYLIGCRDVRDTWTVLHESMDLENGLDCLIEVVISYPPTTAKWLVNPSATIFISSKRPEDDPLYFKPLKLKTLPILYRQQREDIISQRSVEGVLRILTLSVAIAFIFSQLLYTRKITDYLPYMSLVMLGSQAIGYALALVVGANVLSRRNNTENYETPSYDLENSQWITMIDYAVKFLVLVCFILTLRLCQQVWRSRNRLLSQNRNEPHRVPTDKHVLVITLVIHVIGYIFALVLHTVKTGQNPVRMDQYMDGEGNRHTLHMWETLFQEYIGVLQDLFLLPQVIGNIIWQINCKPLTKLYYMGITFVRLLPHVYDYIRGPIPNPFFTEEYEFVNPKFDFYSEFGDIAIPVLAIVLAVIVYIQQRWDYEKLSNTLSLGRYKLLPSRSRMYERLPSESVEAELVPVSNKNVVQETSKSEE